MDLLPSLSDVATTIPPVRGDTLIELLERGAPLQDVDLVDPRYSPWFLRSQYGQNEILIHFDGSVKGGTVWALVRRLTAHDYSGQQNKTNGLHARAHTAVNRFNIHQNLYGNMDVFR